MAEIVYSNTMARQHLEPSPRLPEIYFPRSASVESEDHNHQPLPRIASANETQPNDDSPRLAMSHDIESNSKQGSPLMRSASKVIVEAGTMTSKRIWQWQFWVFDVLPVLMAIGISVEVFFLAKYREVAQAQDDFFFMSQSAHTSLRLALQNAAENALLLLGDLLAHAKTGLPTSQVFENMAFSNPFFNMDKTVAKVFLLIATANATSVMVFPKMEASWANQPPIPPPKAFMYYPAHFVSPPQPELIGLDFNADPINGPYLRLADGTGKPTITHTFQLRGGIPGQDGYVEFRNGAVYHMPFFEAIDPETKGSIYTSEKTGPMRGDLLFVLWLTGILEVTMKPLKIYHTYIFVFDVTNVDEPTYVAHYESPELDTRPFYNKTNITSVTPFNIQGDFVTPFTKDYDIKIAQRTYRMMARGRTNNYANRFSTSLPYILLGLSLGVKALDKLMHFIHATWFELLTESDLYKHKQNYTRI